MALYENNEDLSLHPAAAELGINRSSLYSWLKLFGTGKRAHSKNMRDKAQATTDSEQIRQLEKENAKNAISSARPRNILFKETRR